ncbi:DNA/RNA non-specific endonuclease [Luteolibacter luteus]|uniref:Type VII secretion system protein EssD-like domain-containing protein n=1 Tax=Luteolibacter luteus TaxID=2728835 RepID=A0A858RQG7_9BACT|nr:DNA/RNA non-specific endonuclease [Luteolibacter luteus]QJE99142.1 hypothetical protein HHL09_26295 [Luteolibacter luteus]
MATDLSQGIPPSLGNPITTDLNRAWQKSGDTMRDPLAASTPNPLEAVLHQPWLAQEQARMEKLAAWSAAQSAKLDHAVLDWQKATAGKTIALDFAEDPETARQQALVESYLFIENEGREFRSRAERDGLRLQIAYRSFSGRGADDDDAFFTELEKLSQKRSDTRAFATRFAEDAQLSELVRSSTDYGADARSWELWQEEHKHDPGYDPRRIAEYYEHWNEIRQDTSSRLQPVLGPLRQAWHLMQEEKGYLGFNLRGLYDPMDESERATFIASLSLLARTLPPQQQASFWGNVAKTNDRAWQGYVQDAFEWGEMQVAPELREMEALLAQEEPDPWQITSTLGRNVTDQLLPLGFIHKQARERFTTDGQASAAKAAEVRAELRRRQNFRDDIERIRDEDYDPVRVLSPEGSAAAFGEKFAYGLTGTAPTLAGAAIPWAGLVLTYGTSERMLYRDLRRSFMTSDGVTPGLSDSEATRLSSQVAPILAIPYAAIEKLKIEGMLGKLPFTDKLMNTLGRRVTNGVLRGGFRIGMEAGFQTIGENLQDALPVITQQLVSALSDDLKVPGVVLRNGKDGYLDGYWEKTALTYTIMLPLSIAAAAGGRDRDARARTFAKASDAELLAFIGSAEAVARIREAQQRGPFTVNAAIEQALARRNPFTPEAKAAVEQLARDAQARKAAVDAAQDAGIVPAIYGNHEKGYTVIDPETRQILGTAKDWKAAEQLAIAHSKLLDESNKDAVAYYGSLLEASDLASRGKTREGDQTIFDIAPGNRIDLVEAELLSPGLEQRHAEQASIRERLTGGDGQTLWNILGLSITDMRGLSRDVRRTVNYLRSGATVREVIHEKTHGFRREARARGRLTRDDEVAFIRAYDSITRGKQTRGADGGHVSLDFLPDGIADTEITDTMLDEAISEIMEVELMRMARHGSRRGQADSARARGIGTASRVTVKNITAALKLLSPAAAQRFSHFMEAARSYFGIIFGRTAAINKAERDGKFDREGADAFIDKLFGLHREGSPDVTNSNPAEASDLTNSSAAFSLAPSNEDPDSSRLKNKPEATSSLSSTLRSLFPKPAEAYTFQPYDEQRPRIREIARAQDLRLVQSPDLAAATRRIEEALGIVTAFYEGGDPDIAGFSPNGNPDVVFLNSRPRIADLPLAWTFAHEAMHAAQKDAETRAAELWEEIGKLLTPLETEKIQSLLSRAYSASKHDIEAPAFLARDAISGHDFFGLSHLKNAEAIRKLIVDFYDSLGVLNPTGLKDSPDAELARTDTPGLRDGPDGDGTTTTRTLNGYHYVLDQFKRVIKCTGRLRLEPEQKRNRKAQAEAGIPNREPKDQGGHIIARIFGGSRDEINHIAQDGNFNNSAYKSLEYSWAKTIKEGKTVDVEIQLIYKGNSKRPHALVVSTTISESKSQTGTTTKTKFINRKGGS